MSSPPPVPVPVPAPAIVSAPGAPPALPRHFPSLDGLRGFGILVVVCGHGVLNHPEFTNPVDRALGAAFVPAWVFVDLFFVLSGFLITGILLDTTRSPTYFRAFYGRRLLRIWPAYVALLTAVLLVPSLFGADLAPGLTGWRRAMPWLHLQNLDSAYRGFPDYPVLHLWSLGIEEQFYLAWPMIVFFTPRRALPWVVAGLWAGSIGFRATMFGRAPTPVFFYTHTLARLDGLCLGGLLALMARGDGGRPLAWARRALTAPGTPELLAGVGVGWALFTRLEWWGDTAARCVWNYALVALAMGALLMACVRPGPAGPIRRFAEWGPFVRLGQYSYAMYLIHLPLDHFGRKWFWQTPPGGPRDWPVVSLAPSIFYCAALCAATFAIAWVSWHGMEKRFLELKRWFPYEKPQNLNAKSR